jgi:hypothetical protein
VPTGAARTVCHAEVPGSGYCTCVASPTAQAQARASCGGFERVPRRDTRWALFRRNSPSLLQAYCDLPGYLL